MKKKTLLFIIPRLTIGGAQKSMLSALKILEYDKYDVSLYVRENKLTLIGEIPKEVNVIVNSDTHNYDYDMSSLSLEFIKRIAKLFHCDKLCRWAEEKNRELVFQKKLNYEKNKFFPERHHFDYLISYVNGYNCRFSMDAVNATHKYCFYLGSSDKTPELHKCYLPRYEKIIVDNSSVKEFLINHIPQINEKVFVVENFVDYMDIRRKGNQSNIHRLDKNYIFCSCGRFSEEKGFNLAVDAAKILKQNNISFVWYFVGDGPEREALEEQVKSNQLEENVVFTGVQQNPYPFIANCDIYIQPSYEESFGLTITEAKMLIKPVVSTKTMGGCKQIEDLETGLLADISAESIAIAIMKLLNDAQMQSHILQNLQMIDYSINLEEFSHKWKSLLED